MKTIHTNFTFPYNLKNIVLILAIIFVLPSDNLLNHPFSLAQSISSPSQVQQSINGLYTPTNADRFFEEGRKQLDKEIQRLNQPQITTDDVLTIDEDVLEQKQLLEQQQWLLDILESNNLQGIS